jgi:hypothetical protein
VNNNALNAGTGNVTLNTTTLGLGQGVTGATVTLNNSGTVSGTGTVTAGTLTLAPTTATANIGSSASSPLYTDVNNIADHDSVGAEIWVNNGSGPANVTGTVGNGHWHFSSTGPETITSAIDTPNQPITIINPGNIILDADLTGTTVLLDSTIAGGTISFGPGVIIAANSQTYEAGLGNGIANTASINLVGNSPTFEGTTGGLPTTFVYRQDAPIADSAIPAIGQFGPVATTLAGMSYTIRSDGGGITLSTGANVAGSALTLNAPNGAISIGGNLSLDSLRASAGSGTTIDVVGSAGSPSVETSGGGQTFTGTLTLDTTTFLTDTGAGTIGLGTVAGGGNVLDVTTGAGGSINVASISVGGAVTLTGPTKTVGSITASSISASGGTTAINGVQDISGSASYDDATLTADVKAVTASFGSGTTIDVVGSAASPSVKTSGGGQTFTGTLTLDTTTFLTDTRGGTIGLGTVTGRGNVLDVTIETGGTINVASISVGGAVTLTGLTKSVGSITASSITASGGTTAINGVQDITGLASYDAATVNATVNAGSAMFNSTAALNVAGTSVNTSYGQTYDDAVTLGANTALVSSEGGNITLDNTVDGAHSLTVVSSGVMKFGGAVGSTTPLTALTTGRSGSTAGTTDINGGTVTTSGNQTYNAPVTLTASTILDAGNGRGTITVGPINENGFSLVNEGIVVGITPTGLGEGPDGPYFTDNGSTVILEDVLNGIFATVVVQPETAGTVRSEPSQEPAGMPPGAYLKRGGNVN